MENIYTSATWRLTAWYLALVMAISLIFSGVIYHFATDAISWGLQRQSARIFETFPVFSNDPFFVRHSDVDISAHRVLLNLLYFNILVLVAAGFVSYWLARRTLEPIAASAQKQKQFVADASHELRTPITALKMETEVALLDTTAPKQDLRAALESNLEEANKLDALLSNLLLLSRLDEAATTTAAFTSVPLAELSAAAVKQVTPLAHAKRVTLVNNTGDDAVNGAQSSLVQLLVILLDNAIKYSGEHSEVTISSSSTDDTVSITVRDRGTGIPSEALEHVFDRFYRADSSRTGSNGFGLGLAIAKQIADLHHGSITLKSTAGKGTTAMVQLPKTTAQ